MNVREMKHKYEMPPSVDEMPAMDQQSDAIGDFKFGPNIRLESETQKEFRRRMKTQRRMMTIRMQRGIKAYDSKKRGAWTNPEKKKAQFERAIRKENRIRIPRSLRKEMGLIK